MLMRFTHYAQDRLSNGLRSIHVHMHVAWGRFCIAVGFVYLFVNAKQMTFIHVNLPGTLSAKTNPTGDTKEPKSQSARYLHARYKAIYMLYAVPSGALL